MFTTLGAPWQLRCGGGRGILQIMVDARAHMLCRCCENQQFYCIVETARCAGRLRLDSPHLRDGSCKGRSLSRQPRPLLSCYVTCACARSAPSMHHLASPRMRTSKAFDRLGPREIAWLVLRWLLRWPLRGSSTRKLITPTAAPNPLT